MKFLCAVLFIISSVYNLFLFVCCNSPITQLFDICSMMATAAGAKRSSAKLLMQIHVFWLILRSHRLKNYLERQKENNNEEI